MLSFKIISDVPLNRLDVPVTMEVIVSPKDHLIPKNIEDVLQGKHQKKITFEKLTCPVGTTRAQRYAARKYLKKKWSRIKDCSFTDNNLLYLNCGMRLISEDKNE